MARIRMDKQLGKDDKDPAVIERISELKQKVDDATDTDQLCHVNFALKFLKTEIEDRMKAEAETMSKLKKDRVVFYLNCHMLVSEASLLCGERMGDIVTELPDIDDLKTENSELKSELLTDKRKIIDLQQQIVDKSDVNVEKMKVAVKTEIKSYTDVVKSSCTAALAPRKIETAVKRAAILSDERDRNLMVYELPEDKSEVCVDKVSDVLDVVGEKPYITSCIRIGSIEEGKIRPVKVTLRTPDSVYQVLKNSSRLKTSADFSSVYLSRDYTAEERLTRRKLVEEFKLKKRAHPEKSFRINFKDRKVELRT